MTVLKSNDRRANKKFILDDEGKVESINRGFPYKFDSQVVEFEDILDMSERLPEIFRDPYKMAVQGLPVDDPEDKRPDDWVAEKRIVDAEAKKPD